MASRTFSTSKSYGKPRSNRGRGLAILGGIMAVILVMALSLTTGWPMGPRTKRRMDEAMQDAYQWEEAHFHIGGALHRPHPLSRRPLRPDERDQVRPRRRHAPIIFQTDDANLQLQIERRSKPDSSSPPSPTQRSSPNAARAWCSSPATTTRAATARTTG